MHHREQSLRWKVPLIRDFLFFSYHDLTYYQFLKNIDAHHHFNRILFNRLILTLMTLNIDNFWKYFVKLILTEWHWSLIVILCRFFLILKNRFLDIRKYPQSWFKKIILLHQEFNFLITEKVFLLYIYISVSQFLNSSHSII